jgi:hypothetical protein
MASSFRFFIFSRGAEFFVAILSGLLFLELGDEMVRQLDLVGYFV